MEPRKVRQTTTRLKVRLVFTEALIEYGLGRPFGFTDEELANEILVAAKDNQYAVSEFIHALVQSKPFQSK